MAQMTSSSHSFLLDEVVSAVAFETYSEMDMTMALLATLRTSSTRRERMASFGGLGDYQVKLAGQPPTEDSTVQQYEKTFVHDTYSLKTVLERELDDDEMFGVSEDIGYQHGVSSARTMDQKVADVFNDAFTGATYTGEDSAALCANAHTNVDGGNSQDNSLTSTLDYAGLSTVRAAHRDITDYRGKLMGIRGDLILAPNELETELFELLRSISRPDVANDAANPFNSMGIQGLIWDRLTDSNAWFHISRRLMARNLFWIQRDPFEMRSTVDFDTEDRKLIGRWRASWGFRDWRWVIGSNPS